MSLTLSEFERIALPTLSTYATIECLSPAFDEHWRERGHIDQAIELLAQWARLRVFAQFDVDIVRLEGRTPVLVVTVEATNDDDATVVLYGHMDKQPPLGDWSEGLAPYEPVRRGDRLYARGVADDGYSTFAALLALESLEKGEQPHSRCVVLIEASEESGSPDLDAYLDVLSERLGHVELMICLDSGALTYDRLWVTSSLRGLASVDVTVEVLTRGQHSGSASGIVPSSFRILRQLLDRLEDAETGVVLVPELHGEIPEAAHHAAQEIALEFGESLHFGLPVVENLALMGSDVTERILNQTWRPTLSIVGMAGLPPPEIAGNVLRPSTTASLSFRLPPNVNAARAQRALEDLLTRDVPEGALVSVRGHSADGWSSPVVAEWLVTALEQSSQKYFGRGFSYTGEGGTIPFLASLARRYPNVQFVATGVLGPDSNAHGVDEMLDLPTTIAVTNAVSSIVAAFAHRKDAQ
ncbi:MAG: M20/M25/M40 family metallo-hydrolase [Acidimicrobiaceae bacterium]|nr:M20/M25/M40 family metallo-hydrolase [Acidimicrobiaceae bacterium]